MKIGLGDQIDGGKAYYTKENMDKVEKCKKEADDIVKAMFAPGEKNISDLVDALFEKIKEGGGDPGRLNEELDKPTKNTKRLGKGGDN